MCPRVKDAQSLQDKNMFKRDHFELNFAFSLLFFKKKKAEEFRTICTLQHARRFLSDLPTALTPGRGIPPVLSNRQDY